MDNSQKTAFPKILFVASSLFVVFAIIAGVIVTGGPGKQRKIRMDEKRASILVDLASEINKDYKLNSKLPSDLKFLSDTAKFKDPVTAKLPDYSVVDNNKYKICMTFEVSNKEAKAGDYNYDNNSPYSYDARIIRHNAGYCCAVYMKNKNYGKNDYYGNKAFELVD
jgi:hypothetical protein